MNLKPLGYAPLADRWEQLHIAFKREQILEARISRITWRHNDIATWILDMGDGIQGMVPASESGLVDVAMMPRMVGQDIPVKVKGMDRQAGLVACSCREALADVQEKLFETLQKGQVIDAVVRVILPRALCIDIGGGYIVEVSRRKATRSQARRLMDIFREGQLVKAKVSEVNKQSCKINVSLVEAEPDPWESVNYLRGDKVYGWVAKITDRQIFIEVMPGVTGIAPLPLRGQLKRGDAVTCQVKKFDASSKKLRLGIMPISGGFR
ncbi:hypothetical protein [Desulfoscipio geothermicus]|uniref:Small subunit ribosomal protein S1 n=1 Tax=Desulfoscipio geothermicus DSM 3669 TaxID=1121426 RepID=A0A1I6E431_9FIRM|nr:hypothetical protein [Desulfoscipio geothermicus]SFR12519.1 small subunit ribosomal protein S1 [Desulfoscipio geothermicus DSM 3669]